MAKDNKWVLLGWKYDFKPTIEKYIEFKFHHYKGCKYGSLANAITYIEDLESEINADLANNKSVKVKSLISRQMKKIFSHAQAKKDLIDFFEKDSISKTDVDDFLKNIFTLIHPPKIENELTDNLSLVEVEHKPINETAICKNEDLLVSNENDNGTQENNTINESINPIKITIHTRTFIIATEIFLDLNNQSGKYKSSISNETMFKEFINKNFQLKEISISEQQSYNHSNFSYKNLIKENNKNKIGQMKPQFKQIMENPQIFGINVSKKAAEIYEDL